MDGDMDIREVMRRLNKSQPLKVEVPAIEKNALTNSQEGVSSLQPKSGDSNLDFPQRPTIKAEGWTSWQYAAAVGAGLLAIGGIVWLVHRANNRKKEEEQSKAAKKVSEGAFDNFVEPNKSEEQHPVVQGSQRREVYGYGLDGNDGNRQTPTMRT